MLNKLKKYHHLLFIFILLAVLIMPYFVFAQSPLDNLKKVGSEGAGYADYSSGTFDQVIGTIITAFLSLLGIIFLILILYGGYTWMTAAGDEQKLGKAKDTITRAIIGLILVAGSFAIWQFVSRALLGE